MNKLQWDESLSIGIALIDAQHKTWIARLNDVAAAIEAMQGPQRVAQALGFLIDYTEVHFATEEDAMTEHQYPGLTEHRGKHEELKTTLADLEQQFKEDGATHILAEAVNTFMANWLVNHIKQVDVKFGAFLRERGIVLTG